MKSDSVIAWGAAVMLAAAAPALINAVLSGPVFADTAFAFAYAVALAHAVILGLPIALFYRSQKWTGLSGAIFGGFLIGAIPYAFAFIPRFVPDKPSSSADWVSYLEQLSLLGGYGAVGAIVFWLTLWTFGELEIANRASPESEPR